MIIKQRTSVIALLLIIALVVLYPVMSGRLPSVPTAHAASRTITLVGNAIAWNITTNSNPTITVTQGDTVTVTLSSSDTMHSFVVDVDKDMPSFSGTGCPPMPDIDKCSGLFGPSSPTSYTFTVDFGPGSFSYYCAIHSPYYMVGVLTVLPPPGPDYGVSSSPASLTIVKGTNANSTVSITSLNGFGGQVSLSAMQPASWPTPFFGTNPVTVTAGMTSTSNLTIYVPSGATPGPYSVTVTASNSTTSHPTTVTVLVPVPDFSVTASPTGLTINAGTWGTSTITITGSNGFSGTVNLATSVPTGRGTAVLSSQSIALSPTRVSATSTLNVTNSLGAFNVTVTATSGTSHSTQVLVNGPDFSIAASPTTLSMAQGTSATLTITLSSAEGFTGAVFLNAESSSGGPPVSVNPSSVQVPSAGTISSTITVTTSTSGAYPVQVSPGNYVVTVNASMGSLSHLTTIPVTVTSLGFGAGVLTNPVVIGGIVAAVVIVGVAVYLLSRRPKKQAIS